MIQMTRFSFNPSPEPLTVLQGGLVSKRPGRPRKAADAVAQEKIADITKIRDLGVGFARIMNALVSIGADPVKDRSASSMIWIGIRDVPIHSCVRKGPTRS